MNTGTKQDEIVRNNLFGGMKPMETKIKTYPEMNAEISDILRIAGASNFELYAAQLIEELQKENVELKKDIDETQAEFESQNTNFAQALLDNHKLKEENAELKARINPQTLYGIENGKVEKLLNVVAEYHFDREASTMGGWIEADEIGKYAFLTKAEAETALNEKSEVQNDT